MFWKKKKKESKTITFSKEEVRQMLDSPTKKYEGKIYTQKELNDYLKEVLDGVDNVEILGKTTKNLAFVLADLMNAANLAHKSGVKLDKVWRCPCDEKSCPVCRALHGTRVPIDEPFPDKIYVPELRKEVKCGFAVRDKQGRVAKNLCPPFHEGCRCSLDFEPA